MIKILDYEDLKLLKSLRLEIEKEYLRLKARIEGLRLRAKCYFYQSKIYLLGLGLNIY